jgi:hypothetical protein
MKIGWNLSTSLSRSEIINRARKSFGTSTGEAVWRRSLIGFVLCSLGVLLAVAGLSKSVADSLRNPVLQTGKLATTTTAQADSSVAPLPNASAYANTKLNYEIIDAPNHTYGYDVFADGKLMIHQTSLPALPGNEGFQTKEDATKVALLVIEKIKKGQMPPTISIDEMKTLSVIK